MNAVNGHERKARLHSFLSGFRDLDHKKTDPGELALVYPKSGSLLLYGHLLMKLRNEWGRMQAVRKSRGVTLIELLVTVSVMAILLATGVPNFQSFMNTNRAVALTNELVGALNLARSEAIKRGVQVTVCKTANPDAASPACTTAGGWQTGWLIFTDGGTAGTVDGSDSRLRVKQPSGGSGSITGNGNISNFVNYLPGGDSQGNGGGLTNGTLTVCVGGVERDVVISTTGRIRVAKGTC